MPGATGLPPEFAALLPAPSEPPAPKAPTWHSLAGPTEAALSLGTGMLGQVAGGLAGLGDAGARLFDKSLPAPATVVKRFENALTYQPRTQGGKLGVEAISWPFRELAKGANWAGGKVA